MLGSIADVASIISSLISLVTLFLVVNMSSTAKGDSSKASNQSIRAKDVSNSDVRQTANDHHAKRS